MRRLFYLVVLTSLMFSMTDTLEKHELTEWMKLNPSLKIKPSRISLNNLAIDEKTNAIVPIVFFKAQSNRVDDFYTDMLSGITVALERNPDVILMLRGYYSRTYDNIRAPIENMQLAERRIEAVRSKLIIDNPSLVNRVFSDEGYDRSRLFAKDTSEFDMRVEIGFRIKDYRNRNILVQESHPYIRISYRDIVDALTGQIDSVLLRNPDVNVLIHSNGNPWDEPLFESYKRLKRIKDRLAREISPRESDRITMLISPAEQKPRAVDLRLVFSPLGADLNNREVVSYEILDQRISIYPDWNRQIPVKSHGLLFYSAGVNRYTEFTKGSPPDTITAFLSDFNMAFLPGENSLYLGMTDLRNLYEISAETTFDFEIDQFIYRCEMDAPIYAIDDLSQLDSNDCVLYRVANKLISFSEMRRKMMNIKIKSNVFSQDSISIRRSEYVWEQISAMMICELGLRNMDALQRWLERRSVHVIIEPNVVLEYEENPNKWLYKNRSNIIIEFTNE